jgi:hypothetical protein
MKKIIIGITLTIYSLMTPNISIAQKLAFPGADGCGKYATGGRGGEVVNVTNLNDDGLGSLRHALDEIEEPRIIVFNVSGTIFLKSEIELDHGNVTIAGQTAPGDGICIAGYGLDIEADNIIIRYVRFRPGDIAGKENDALTIKRSSNVIVDHCSMSWGTDETCSCYDNTNFTLQWCIISESLNKSVHHKGSHGYGGIWGGKGATFHHNLIAHHKSRNPRLHGSRYHKEPKLEKAEIVNNVIYNWGSTCIYGGEAGNYNIAGNFFKAGPGTKKDARSEILEPYKPFSNYYFKDNYIYKNKKLSENNLISVNIDDEDKLTDVNWLKQPLEIEISDYKYEDAYKAYKKVLKKAGASINRDKTDKRIIKDVKQKSATYGKNGIIDSQKEVGGWPTLKQAKATKDTDNDGMPDDWEQKHKLDPLNYDDNAHYNLHEDYTNIEVYINNLTK